jgi:hypothetical protein
MGEPLAVFIGDPSAEAEGVAQALRAAGFLVVDVPMSMLVPRVAVQKPRVVVLDADAPDARDVIEELRSVAGGQQIEIVLLGGVSGGASTNADHPLSEEAVGFFPRPVDVSAVVHKVEVLTGGPGEYQPARASAPPSIAYPRRTAPPPSRLSPPPRRSSLAAPPTGFASEVPRPSPTGFALPRASSVPPSRPSSGSSPPVPMPPGSLPPGSIPPASGTNGGTRPGVGTGVTSGTGTSVGPAPSPGTVTFAPGLRPAPLSRRIEQLLADAEERIGGQARVSDSMFPSPDEELAAVLPADLLAALDEPLEEEDDDLEPERDGARVITAHGRRSEEVHSEAPGHLGHVSAARGDRDERRPDSRDTRYGEASSQAEPLWSSALASVAPPPPPSAPGRGRESQRADSFTPRDNDHGQYTAHDIRESRAPRDVRDSRGPQLDPESTVSPTVAPVASPYIDKPASTLGGAAMRFGGLLGVGLGQGPNIGIAGIGPSLPAGPASIAGYDGATMPPSLAPNTVAPPTGRQSMQLSPMSAMRKIAPVPIDVPRAALAIPSVLGPGDAAQALAQIIAARVTGSLALENTDGVRRVVVREGDLISAASGLETETLLAFLGARGELPRELVDRLAGKVPPFGRHAGAALIANGHLRQDQLWPVLRAHAEWVIGRAIGVSSGTLALEAEPPGRLRGEPSVFGGATGAEVYLEVVRRVVSPDLAVQRLGGLGARLSFGANASMLAECALEMTLRERLERNSGETVGAMIGASPEADLASVLYGLAALGVLETMRAIAGPRPPPSPAGDAPDALDADAVRARVRARMQLVEEGDYFELLGVNREATGYEVRRAFLELRRAFEPTRILTPELADLRTDIETITFVLDEAYEILRDSARRERYRRAIS